MLKSLKNKNKKTKLDKKNKNERKKNILVVELRRENLLEALWTGGLLALVAAYRVDTHSVFKASTRVAVLSTLVHV